MLRRSKRQTGKSVNRSTLKIAKISKNTAGGGLSSVDERSGTFEVGQAGSQHGGYNHLGFDMINRSRTNSVPHNQTQF